MRLREFVNHSFWHGSDISGITKLEPKDSDLIGRKVVFAAIYPEVAVAMAGHWSDDDFEFGRDVEAHQDPEKVPYRLVELRKGAFDEFFSDPVFLYEVDSKYFK